MPQAQHSVTIQQPPETVFAYLFDGEKCTEWRRGVLDIKRISGEGGVGSTLVLLEYRDERLTTSAAERYRSGKRFDIDSAAAALLLQDRLDERHRS